MSPTTTETTRQIFEDLRRALTSAQRLLCEHEEFKDDCPRCLRRQVRALTAEVDRLKAEVERLQGEQKNFSDMVTQYHGA